MLPSAVPTDLSRFTVAVHFLQMLLDYASRHQLNTGELLARVGIQPNALADANDRVPYESFRLLCEMVALELRDPFLGLRLGQSIRPGHMGSHGYALITCATALELAQQAARYSALTIDAGHNTFELRGTEYVRSWRSNLPGGTSMGRLQDEIQHSIGITLARWCSGRDDLNPNWVSFRHAQPDDTRPYQDLFRCPVHFGKPETAMGWDSSLVNLPLPTGNAQLQRIMEDVSASLLKKLGSAQEPAWLTVARRATLDAFQRGLPEIQQIAKSTGMSEAEIRKELTLRGTSFRGFIDDLRRTLAISYIRDPALELVDIAYLLGFSEQSAFQRAFKRWTGMTPGEYRRTPP